MGIIGNSPVSLLLILCIILVLFGTNKVKQVGADLGEALKQFRRAIREDEDKSE
ncbi:MAG: twin-arginine translocase TatA/TatE family subunit [Gammaproteobacteria bacterium]|nr:twin-arginine translocase TatA/TatE family subunit [Gammaproteobacteria bacterium]